MNNTRWKTIQSVEALEFWLFANQHAALYDMRRRENRYVLKTVDGAFLGTVDGRSCRALWFRLTVTTKDGGYQLRVNPQQ